MELKPCPVCGATKGLYILEDYHEFEWYVFCDNCKTSLCNENAQTKEDAIETWNTRYERTCHLDKSFIAPMTIDGIQEWYCSNCDEFSYFDEDEPPNYCSNCGAKVVE